MQISDQLLGLARKGDLDAVQSVLEQHPELLNQPLPGHNRTLLWEATHHGRSELVHELLRRGADPNIPGRNRAEICILLKPYVIAVQKKREDVLDALEKDTEMDLFSLCYLGDLDGVRRLVSRNPERINQVQAEDVVWEVLPIHAALVAEQDEVVEFLFAAGTMIHSTAPLLYEIAIGLNRLDVIQDITENGGDPSMVHITSIIRSDEKVLEYFLEHGVDVNQAGYGGWPPLAYVSRGDKGNHPETVHRLIALGARVNDTGPKRRTAFHAASQAGNLEVVKLLVQHGGDLDATMTTGETPLELAKRKKKNEVIAYLIQMGATE